MRLCLAVINELSYFANITLSSFYFDINKDCLYADRVDGVERRRVLTVLDEVLTTMTRVLAPVLPHSGLFSQSLHPNQCRCSASSKV